MNYSITRDGASTLDYLLSSLICVLFVLLLLLLGGREIAESFESSVTVTVSEASDVCSSRLRF